MAISKHARRRLQQRGYRESDIDLILQSGEEGPEAYVLKSKDVDRVERELKWRISRLRRLQGSAVIVQEDTVLTVYRPDKARRRRLLARRKRG